MVSELGLIEVGRGWCQSLAGLLSEPCWAVIWALLGCYLSLAEQLSGPC